MRTLVELLVAVILSLCTLSAFADSAVRVKALNYPAWLVRNYETFALQPGMRLQSNDLIRTGEGGRVQLQLTDSSIIKLGESSRLLVEKLPASLNAGDVSIPFSLQALRGLFRVTSKFPDNVAVGQQLELGVGDIEAAMRNADIWVSADLAQDAVCLIEGEVAVASAGAARVDMNQALSCYVKPKAKAPLPVDQIDMQQHQLWIAEIELRDGFGIAAENGQWQLVLISLTDAGRAEGILKSFRERGFAVEDKTVERQGRTLHRLLLPGFISIDAALNARSRVEQQLGVSETWVWKAN